MKLVQWYLIAVFLMIGFLVASTAWQYQQLRTSAKNISAAWPQNANAILDTGNTNMEEKLNETINQFQSKTNSPEALLETTEFMSSDGNLKLSYPSNWQKADLSTIDSQSLDGGKILLGVYKSGDTSSEYMPSYLTVNDMGEQTKEEIINEYKKNIQNSDSKISISESQTTTNQGQEITLIGSSYSAILPPTNQKIDFLIKVAIISAGDNYIVSVVSPAGNEQNINKINNIFKSIEFNNATTTSEQ